MKWFRTFWRAFTFTNGRFSRSGFLRTLFSFQLLWVFSWGMHHHILNNGITWEALLFAAVCGAYFLGDYRVLDKLVEARKNEEGKGDWWVRGSGQQPRPGPPRAYATPPQQLQGGRKTTDIEGID